MGKHNEEDWEGFWRNTREAAAYRSGAPQQAVLEQFWGDFFKRTLPMFPGARILDLACGNGAVARSAIAAARTAGLTHVMVCGLDRSDSGLVDLYRRLPSAYPVNADVLMAPFRDGVFDLVTSQFGVEYAGSSAVAEAARLVAPGGVLAAILHLQGGGI
ncbi:MAG: methyltransferase domain-containing protein, partial [Xanthomonadales bacterium]|nr:methyltransferase domain-containing protein [Xanthomonadales bacterium]